MSRTRPQDTVVRFAKTTRWLHWSFATCFLALAGTGAVLALRERLGLDAEALATLVGVHKTAGVCLVAAPALVWLSGQTRETARDLAELLRWSRDDLRWLALQPRALLGRAPLPPAGKLNAGQKANGLLSAGLAAGLAGTGVLLWLRPGALAAWFAHTALFVLWIPAFLGHVSLATVVPSTRPALRGMLWGRVDRAWAEHHHPLWARPRSPAPNPRGPERLDGRS